MSPFFPAFLVSAAICGGICYFFLRDSIAEGKSHKPSILGFIALYIISPVFATVVGIFIGAMFPAGMWDFSGISGGALGGFFGVIGAGLIASIRRTISYK
ncbi:MAG: hypothetical protein HGB28_05915 [Oscillochloris sp.]|nr:hypothetical protein [Oscillochloris sp.]